PARPRNQIRRGNSRRAARRRSCRRFQYAAAHLVELHRFEERAEVAFAEALIALPLNDLEEDRADHGLGEDLQEEAARRISIDEDLAFAQLIERLTMPGQALLDELVVRI